MVCIGTDRGVGLVRRRPSLVASLAAGLLAVALGPVVAPRAASAASRCTVTLSADGNTAAVQREMDGDRRRPVVCLRPGHYKGARLIASRSGELRAVGEGRVILDAGGRGRVLTVVTPGVELVLSGVTLTEGSVENGGAIAVEAKSRVRLQDSWITRNKASDHGGAVYVRAGGRVELVRTRVSVNSAATGSALWVEGDSTIRLVSSLIHDNKSRGGADDSALVVRPGCDAQVLHSTIAYNPGHGIFVAPAGPDATPATLRVDSSILMGAPDAISIDRAEAGAAYVHRSVLYGRTGFVPYGPACRRELPVFDLENAERYRPTYGSPAIGIGLCTDRDSKLDVAGTRRSGRCTAGALEADPIAARKTLAERLKREASDRIEADKADPHFWPDELDW